MSGSKVNVKCLPGNRSLTNQVLTLLGLLYCFKGQCRGQRSRSKVKVKGLGQRSISSSNVCQVTTDFKSHQPSADFSGAERKKEKEEKEHSETIKGPPPGGA